MAQVVVVAMLVSIVIVMPMVMVMVMVVSSMESKQVDGGGRARMDGPRKEDEQRRLP